MVSDGPSRDIDAIRQMDFQLLLGGVTAGHGEMAIQSINVPVSVGGMDVAPGEMIHMDENGAVKFPAEHAQLVLESAHKFLDDEHKQLAKLREARSVADIKTAFTTYK